MKYTVRSMYIEHDATSSGACTGTPLDLTTVTVPWVYGVLLCHQFLHSLLA